MKFIFWGSTGVIAYTYFGYLAWLWCRNHWRNLPVRSAAYTPYISVVLIVRNEAEVIERKLRNLIGLNYPAELFEVVIVSDNSTDATAEILLRQPKNSRLQVILSSVSRGKAAGLNDAVKAAHGDVIVFTDARQMIESDALRLLAENFSDPSVGCASGELMLGSSDSGEVSKGMGLYWKIEKKVRELESASGSVVGATGALYAIRKSLFVPLPPGTILDDVYVPMNVVREGARVIFDSRAHAWDVPSQGTEREFSRKVRTLTGNYQLLQLVPWLLASANPIRFEFVSHKLMRLGAPFALITILISSALIHEPLYRVAFFAQCLFYGLSLLSMARLKDNFLGRLADAASTFVVLNTAALVAFSIFITGRKAVWAP